MITERYDELGERIDSKKKMEIENAENNSIESK